MKNISSSFFDPIQQTRYIGSENYRKVEHYLEALQALTKLYDLSFYIVDYYKKSFHYVSPNPLFLSGYSQEEVMNLGYDFYPLCVPSDDLELLLLLNKTGFNFFYNLPVSRREKATISYDFRLKHKGNQSVIMINHKLSPLILTDDGNIWMAICLVTLSTRKEPGDVHIIMQDDKTRYNLNIEEKVFEQVKIKKLTNREKEILRYIAIGISTNAIAKKLGISDSTVKNHKTKILKKLNASTSAEAVFFASKQNLI
ncbi:regulatory protein, luxR family [Tangfeifania diversioriginum]|uniref:Regulatory protein, luxR family n=1 Tax=Tangfeifania diversioriginum TaxID=1168035 RepID=A0A1M6NTX2_9BACT|nr:LuxR C-terminal-related transcriptional regulator [Tangfeifania diversioriginum]SHJ99064.1 regulatory protein, luxR family [Tangfeifania diversioriginum]